MEMEWLVAAIGFALCVGWALWRRSANRRQGTHSRAPSAPSTETVKTIKPAEDAVAKAHRKLPHDLASLELRSADDLAADERAAVMGVLRTIPRPPRSLYELTSTEFMSRASSADISELVLNEPLVAALVMGKVHSPVFGLSQPVKHLGQAITFLGTQTVRSICLRYLLGASFSASDREIKQVFDNFGEASTLASELSLRLANAMRLPESSAIRTAVILSFTGHLAAAVLELRGAQVSVPTHPGRLLPRVMQQQFELGIAASEIGRLLMTEWNLSPSLVANVASIDRVLVESAEASGAEDKVATAVCYLSARIAERLVMGEISNSSDIGRFLDHDPDFFHVGSYLTAATSVDWRQALMSEETTAGLFC